jgi:tetratricopeptide (TPR) repeat protein
VRASRRAAVAVGVALAAGGCAGSWAGRREAPSADDGLAAWAALVDGRPADAQRLAAARLAKAPGDAVALFTRATIAYERGDGPAALDDYTGLLALAARGEDRGWGPLLAPVAAARALALDDDVAAGVRRKSEAALLAVSEGGGARRLPWQARLELARLGDHIARRAGVPTALDHAADTGGCARAVFEAGSPGPLPHLDLDNQAGSTLRPAEWRPAPASGCRISASATASWDGRATAQSLRAAIDVSAGAYDVVLDYAGEGRLTVDGGPALRHGSDVVYGPRVSAARVQLGAGHHDLDLRLASQGGRTELALLVLPVAGGAERVRFVDPRRPGGAAGGPGLQREGPAMAPRVAAADPGADAAAALADYCVAFVADREAETDEALAAAARLAHRQRFAVGLALAGLVARNDPTLPPSFARDAGRARLRAAVSVAGGGADLARAWQALASIDLEDDRTREAIDDSRAAARAAPSWWAPEVVLSHALRARGLEWDADQALDRASAKAGPDASAPCLVVESLLRRADERRDLDAQARLEDVLAACDAQSEARIDRLRARGELAPAAAALRAALRLGPERDDLAGELAQVLWAQGRRADALGELASLVARDPYDPLQRVRMADAQAAAGQGAAARETIRQALFTRPDVAEVRRAARALGMPLPLDAYRLDGRQVIRAFEASGRRYAAPAVVVLDRAVARVFPDGAEAVLTHEIVRVESKDAIDRWGEVEVPQGAEILTLRTHKPDGTTREPEEIVGKETVSAADLAIGDYVEWETLETKPPSDAFAPGFLGDRFYFQSFDAPLDRSEFLMVTPRGMKVDLDHRAGAPVAEVAAGPDGTTVTTFAARRVPQLFAERSSVPAIEYVPSVRASSGVTWPAWARFLEEQLYGTARSSPALRAVARTIAADAGAGPDDRTRRAAAILRWVTENIEAADDLRDPATFTLARGRGNRLALVLALARELGVPARPVLARSRLVAEPDAPAPVQELDDFGDTLVEMDLGPVRVYADPRLRHAAFGYLPPGLDGARTMSLTDAHTGLARSAGTADGRTVDMTIRLDEQGGGVAVATEELTGWPALEWAELVDKLGADRAKLRQDFEQRWLGVHFPGARLRDLDVDLPRASGGAAGPGTVRVRYSFVDPQLAVRSGHEMKLQPTFFRSQPGRRFATEPQRSTTLVLGFDVPFRMTATVELPHAAKLMDPPARQEGVIARKGGYRFVEERSLRPGSPDVLVLRRESALPLMRVPPQEYAGVAADLRRVDGLEQQEIRIGLRARRPGDAGTR